MNIAIVTNRLIKGEGQGRVNYEIARIAVQKGHEVTCIASDVDTGLKERQTCGGSKCRRPASLFPSLETNALPDRVLRGFDQTVKHSTSRFVMDLTPGRLQILILSILSTAHGVNLPSHTSRVNRGPYAWYQWLYSTLNAHFEQQAFKRSEIIVAVSEKVREELTAIGVAPSKTQVIS